ncbi:hypothetical protein L0F63_006842 [Massospora cicadina]|nr:hypothetical protein L0F63_006842 [Massospora cicadina]
MSMYRHPGSLVGSMGTRARALRLTKPPHPQISHLGTLLERAFLNSIDAKFWPTISAEQVDTIPLNGGALAHTDSSPSPSSREVASKFNSQPAAYMSPNKQLQLWEEQEALLAQKHMGSKGDGPLSESELRAMYEEVVSLSRMPSDNGPQPCSHLKGIVEKLRPVLFDEEEDARMDDVINQALIVSRELGQKHLSLHVFNLLIYVLSLDGRSEQANRVVATVHEMGINPNEKTYSFLMNAYANDGKLSEVIETFGRIHANKMVPSPNSYAILIKAYAKHKRVEDAFDVYEKMKKLGLEVAQPVFATLIQACIKSDQIERAWRTFDHMRLNVCQADVITFTLMLSACAKRGETERAINLFEEMGEQGSSPTNSRSTPFYAPCAPRPDYYAAALEIADRMVTQYGYQLDIFALNILLHAAQTGRRLDDARKFFSKIIALESDTPNAHVAYTNLFFAYAKQFKALGRILHLPAKPPSPSTALPPTPTTVAGCIAEARLVMQHMEAICDDHSLHALWPRVAYLLIHTNYCNFQEAMALYDTYYTNVDPHPNVYDNMLSMCFKLRNKEGINKVWPRVEQLLAPIRPRSTLSYVEKKDYKAKHFLSKTILVKLYRRVINGFARVDNLELALTLLEGMAQDLDLKSAMTYENFYGFYQKVHELEDKELMSRLQRLCPDPNGEAINRAKAKQAVKWAGVYQRAGTYSEHIRREQELLNPGI